MELNLEGDFLIKNKLLPNQLIILYLIQGNKINLIKKLKTKLHEDPFREDIEKLKERNLIEGATTSKLKLTTQGKEMVEGTDIFKDILNLFPTSVIRPDGKKDYLKTDTKRSKTKYLRKVGRRRDMHDFIMSCLKFEIKHRTLNNEMQWMKKLPNWLNSEEWVIWGERMKDEARNSILDLKEETYGEELE